MCVRMPDDASWLGAGHKADGPLDLQDLSYSVRLGKVKRSYPVPVLNVRIGTMLQQYFHDFSVVPEDSKVQRGVSLWLTWSISLRSKLKQNLHHLRLAVDAGQVEWAAPCWIMEIGVKPTFEQLYHC
jgi:hypothetical protein